MSDEEAWAKVGQLLREAREALRPVVSKREAARRSGLSEISWRQLEAGVVQLTKEVTKPPNPSDARLAAAAEVVGLDPAEIFAIVGRTYRGPDRPARVVTPDLAERVTRLEEQMSAVKAAVVEQGRRRASEGSGR